MIQHVDKYPIYSIFDRDARFYYFIPKYQRSYTWGYNEWDSLFNDIYENNEGYFIGSIICINLITPVVKNVLITSISVITILVYSPTENLDKLNNELLTVFDKASCV